MRRAPCLVSEILHPWPVLYELLNELAPIAGPIWASHSSSSASGEK